MTSILTLYVPVGIAVSAATFTCFILLSGIVEVRCLSLSSIVSHLNTT